YKEYQQLNLPAIGEEILKKWEESSAFEKSIELRNGKKSFVFYEGPPSANGMPGIHHVISRTLKDIVCRYKTMQGYQVRRKGGWDTHGLPIELGVEKLLGITKEDIGKKISVEEYNATCRKEVLKYKDKWNEITKQMGYWVDLERPYITFENNYIESLWWCLKELYNKKLLYEDVSIQPYSPAAGTGLSSHELNQPGTYKDVKDTSCVAMFKAVKNKQAAFLFEASKSDEVFFLAWTTTPWTLPSNLGLAVGANIEYVLVRTFNPYSGKPCAVVLAKNLLHKYFPEHLDEWAEGSNHELYEAIINWLDKGFDESMIERHAVVLKNEFDNLIKKKQLPYKILLHFKGSQIEDCLYEQLLPFESNTIEEIERQTPYAKPFKVITGDFVTTEDGTGIVHTAPAFGADDFKAGKKNNLGILTLVDKEGKFIEGVGEFSGRFVKNYKDDPHYTDVNIDICVRLKKENSAFKIEKYEHNYPHCWRTDKPIIYYPLDAWFIKTTAVKDRMVELNKTINWKPASTGTGRFGNWLENMVDWNLSRSRYWGTPLPIWRTEVGDEEKCIGSIEELNSEIRKAREVLKGGVNKKYLHNEELDLHKPYVDEIILVSAKGKPMTRVPDLIDVWFDSGAMPYAQWHFPFENVETFKDSFPADFIAEGVDQTRGWFYTLHAIACLLFDSVAYKTCVSNGLVLDKNGNKMSKRLGNVVDPFKTIETFGPDATRWYLVTNASPWDNMKFDPEGIKEVQRKFFGTLYNTYQFFALYANVDGFAYKEKSIALNERPEMDRWILSELNTLVQNVQQSFDDYEPTQAGRAIEKFVDEQLSNWYVRLCRRRFWKGEYEQDKISAYQTLYQCLTTLSRLISPVAPFFADWLFCNLNHVTNQFAVESVHHVDFPVSMSEVIDGPLQKRMQIAQDISSLILSLRKKVSIKVRQPLQKALITAIDPEIAENIKLAEEIIKSETNIKEVEIVSAENSFIRKKAKANFKTLGKRLGTKMRWAAERIQNLNNVEIEAVQKTNFLLNKDFKQQNEEPLFISAEDIEISTNEIPGFEVSSKGSITVALDITINEALKMEGEAREFVNKIQNIRKDQNFEVTDKIFVKVSENESLKASFTQFNNYICAEILAEKIEFLPEISDGTSIDVNEITLKVNVIKKGDHNGNKKSQ
ncbi:MAG: isoleucine--tRNA ligase, partial [Ginsengibacter sp.]